MFQKIGRHYALHNHPVNGSVAPLRHLITAVIPEKRHTGNTLDHRCKLLSQPGKPFLRYGHRFALIISCNMVGNIFT